MVTVFVVSLRLDRAAVMPHRPVKTHHSVIIIIIIIIIIVTSLCPPPQLDHLALRKVAVEWETVDAVSQQVAAEGPVACA